MADIPVIFREKVTGATSASGEGYPFRISASDLDQNFAYAALDVEEGWFEEVNIGEYSGRKLKLPAVPEGEGVYLLGSTGGDIGWIGYQEKEVSICEGNYATTGKILFKPS
jgi:hypothetical protein